MATVGSVKINLVMGQIGQHGNVTNCIRVNLKKRVKRPDILHPTFLDLGCSRRSFAVAYFKTLTLSIWSLKVEPFQSKINIALCEDWQKAQHGSFMKKRQKKQKKRKEKTPQARHKAELNKLSQTTSVNTISCFYVVEQIKKRLKWNKS